MKWRKVGERGCGAAVGELVRQHGGAQDRGGREVGDGEPVADQIAVRAGVGGDEVERLFAARQALLGAFGGEPHVAPHRDPDHGKAGAVEPARERGWCGR